MKPVEEKAAELAITFAPSKTPSEGPRAETGGVNGFLSPSEEPPPAPQGAVQDGPAAPPKAPPGEPAMMKQAPPVRPALLQGGLHPQGPAVSSPDTMQPQPQVEAEHQPCFPTNGFSPDSSEASVLSPTSLSDSDLLEAVLDGTSSLASEKMIPKEPVDVQVDIHMKEGPLPNANNVPSSERNTPGDEEGEISNEISHLAETVGQEKGREERKCIIVKTSVTTLSEGIEGFDVPDGLVSPDLPSVSEALRPSPKPEPKRKRSFYKPNKKNPGNLSITFNKAHVGNASLLMPIKGKFTFVVFLLHLTFYILCICYVTVYS